MSLAIGVLRYINMTIETLRKILHRNHQWEHLRPDYKKLKEPKSAGKALSYEDEEKLFSVCRASYSRGLLAAVSLALLCRIDARRNTAQGWGARRRQFISEPPTLAESIVRN